MDIVSTAQKFSANPSQCTAEEIAALAQGFHLASPQAEQLIAIANSHKTKWQGLLAEIKRAHFERTHMDALTKNPFASEADIEAMPTPSDLATMPQSKLGAMIFGV